MNIALWVLQVFGALVYLASGVMKVFLFDTVTADVPSFGALPKQVWATLGLIELVCAVALVLPAVLQWRPSLVAVAATILAIESLVFIWVHLHYRETPAIVMSLMLGLLMAFVAYGRTVLRPIG